MKNKVHALSLSPTKFPLGWAAEYGEDPYGLWMTLVYKGVRSTFRWIEPGTFTMGSPEDEKGRYDDETQHKVSLSKGFWLAETVVTQALWESVMDTNPSEFKGENRPVEMVSWEDTQTFIEKFNAIHLELNAALPSEAQWEYACRAGTKTPFNFGKTLTDKNVNYRGVWNLELGDDKEKWAEEASSQWGEGAIKQTVDVKHYPRNAWGLYEMNGNVWEWCQDVFIEEIGTDSVVDPLHSPAKPEEGASRVIRGGSWYDHGRFTRSAYRSRSTPDFRNYGLGFRLSLMVT